MMQRHGASVRHLGKVFRAIPAQRAAKIDARTRRFKLSDSGVALDGHSLATSGWDLSRAKENLPVLFGHDADNAASLLGQWRNIRVEGDDLLGDADFMSGDVNPMAQTVLDMVDGGWLRACSVGFVPLEGKPSKRGPGCYDFSKQLLLEASIVPVGSLDSALVSARSAGVDLRPLSLWAESALDTGKSRMSQDQLTAIRRAAGGAMPKVYPMPRQDGGAFRSLAEQAQAILSFRSGGDLDPRLERAPAGNNELDPSGGGFLVDTQFIPTLIESLFAEAVLLPRTDVRETTGPIADVKLPAISESSRADGSRQGGALAYWLAESATISPTFPRFSQLAFSGKKLAAVSWLSNEALNDSPILESSLRAAFAAEFSFAIDRSIFAGTGAGQPLGILNAPCKIMVAKESGQAAKTIVYENVLNMYTRMVGPVRSRAVWLVNQDVEPQLFALAQAIGTAGYPVYLPPVGIPGSQYGTLFGRPVIPVEYASTLGTEGDIVFADLGSYIVVRNPLETALSLDFSFTTDQALARFVMRLDGAPAYASAITPLNGSKTLSPCISLAAR